MRYNAIRFSFFPAFDRVFCDIQNNIGLSLHGAIDLAQYLKENGFTYLRLFQYEHATYEGKFITSVMIKADVVYIFYEAQ